MWNSTEEKEVSVKQGVGSLRKKQRNETTAGNQSWESGRTSMSLFWQALERGRGELTHRNEDRGGVFTKMRDNCKKRRKKMLPATNKKKKMCTKTRPVESCNEGLRVWSSWKISN